jgi:hypothetical protein
MTDEVLDRSDMSLEKYSHKIGSGGKLVMGLMELTGVRKYR